jgi:signal recognition particle receptor subunit beta
MSSERAATKRPEMPSNRPRSRFANLPQTTIRKAITPYLPPPVIQAIERIDPKLEPFVGPEATVTLTVTFLLAWTVFLLLRFVTSRITGSGRAIADEDEDNVLSPKQTETTQHYEETVLLCGPPGAGKTRLFYQLCFGESNLPTVQSIKANVGITLQNEHGPSIRYMDWPGHAPLSDDALQPILKDKPRIVLVLDSTQPVASAADTLFNLLAYVHRQGRRQMQKPLIFVACHKSDISKAKNSKRVKIQIRSELERLLKVHSSDTPATPLWWPSGEPLELDELSFCDLHFTATNCEGEGSPELVAFTCTGNVPDVA